MLEFIRRVTGGPSASIAPPPPPGPIEVIDGDGIKRDGHVYRLAGFDAPEARSKNVTEKTRGIIAGERLRELIELAQSVELIPLKTRPDKYKRTVVKLVLDGRDVADIAISEGWGRAYNGRGKKENWGDPAARFGAGSGKPADVS